MRYPYLLIAFIFTVQLNAQVCCSPVGNGQAGGGAFMDNWSAHWPNMLFSDQKWHWMTDLNLNTRTASGNIEYGPQVSMSSELSRSVGNRNVLYFSAGVDGGSIHERVTFSQSETLWYSGSLMTGLRRALGNKGRRWTQVQLTAPSSISYTDDEFPFNARSALRGELLFLQNIPMPWSAQYPAFLSLISLSGLYQKNYESGDDILSDNLGLLHISSAIHNIQPLFIGPFIQLRSEQLLVPPSIWTSQREKRSLSSLSVGLDLSISRPNWDLVKIRVGIPVFSQSSSNGFPDGTQPSAYLNLSVNTGGILKSD